MSNKCYFCGTELPESIEVCDNCESRPIYDIAKEALEMDQTTTDPLTIMKKLMKHPNLKVHSPVHHFLLPASLLCAYYNIIGKQDEKMEKILEAEIRGKNILGGFCGYYGTCGAAVGGGIFLSLINNVKPTTVGEDWKYPNVVTAKCLNNIADTLGPRCCKSAVYTAISTVKEFMKEQYGFVFGNDESKTPCQHSIVNSDCKKENCKFNENFKC